MTILVTGGSGFVGTRLNQLLVERGYSVRNLDIRSSDQPGVEMIVGDIRDLQTCKDALKGTNAVFHLAALYRDDVFPKTLYDEVNVEGTRNIVEALEHNDISRLIFVSSFSVYGLDGAGMQEDGALSPLGYYGSSKAKAEVCCKQWQAKDEGRHLTMVRPSVIFGETNRGNVYTLLNQIWKKRFVQIGKGENFKSMAYVGNIAAFLIWLMENPEHQQSIYNYADKPDMRVGDIVSVASRAMGRKTPKLPIPQSAALMLGRIGDVIQNLTQRPLILNSDRISKFFADTSLPTERLDESGFARPHNLQEAFVQTVKSEFNRSSPMDSPRQ